jgi:hydroxymethylpyrimidine pyrophosphatase-like HAD family hydrolase
MAVRVIYTDVDGTMVGRLGSLLKTADGEWTMETASALIRALSSGIDVVLVSGRNRRQLREGARMVGIMNYISELGAEIVYDQGKEIIPLIKGFEKSEKTVYEAIRDSGAVDDLFSHFGDRLEYHTPWSNELRYYSHLLRGHVDLVEANSWLAENGYMDLKLVDNGQLASRSENLNHLSEMHAYHLLPESVDKAGALRFDMKRRGFAKDEAIALGDSWADVSVAPEVGTFYLMKNGFDADPTLNDAIKEYGNITVTEREKSLGWADVVNAAVEGNA